MRTLSVFDIELVVIDGRVQLASEEINQQLPRELQKGLEPLLIDGVVRWLRAPIKYLLDEAENILGEGSVELSRRKLTAFHLSNAAKGNSAELSAVCVE
jgi:hypothetical protein